MDRVRSGLNLLCIALVVNVASRFVVTSLKPNTPVTAGGTFLLMLGSVVLALFGLYRVATGLAARRR